MDELDGTEIRSPSFRQVYARLSPNRLCFRGNENLLLENFSAITFLGIFDNMFKVTKRTRKRTFGWRIE